MMFVYEELYNYFNNDPLFNTTIVLTPHLLTNNKPPTNVSIDKFYQLLDSLKDKNYNVIEGYDFKNDLSIDLESVCRPDIVFYLLPHQRAYPENLKITNLPKNILYVYMPYGELYQSQIDDSAYKFGWVEQIWKRFCNNQEYFRTSAEKSNVGSSNVVISGSARMDSLINHSHTDNDYKWIYPRKNNIKRIIWAPHHSLSRPGMDSKYVSSTFDENYDFFYEYAKKTS